MAKTSRNLSAQDLIKILKKFDYQVTRQTGSHIRLKTLKNGEHNVTIPNHDPIKIGTLNNILNDIALHFDIAKDQIISS